jgi:SAM-dependent methyltransferase
MHPVTARLQSHYRGAFEAHGTTTRGVDWGDDDSRLELRYQKMLALCTQPPTSPTATPPTLLDAGCGYGGLLSYTKRLGSRYAYTGVEACGEMLPAAREAHPEATFLQADVLDLPEDRRFDYVVCNGILTQKLETPGREMDVFAGQLIRKLFGLAIVGVAFNVMTTKVNFFSNNLYYRNPAELLSWCLTEITPSVRIDHSYPLYEYTMYLYR